ncbi:ABC transporter permease [Arsenicitalea aurantiaca]|nr:ABC transporter permease [Arsenicitalea aurantiaca]
MLERLWRIAPALSAITILLLLWESYVALSGIAPTTLPAPSRIWAQGVLNWPSLAQNTWPTVQATVLGFMLSLCVAFVLSVVIDFSPALRRALLPVLVISQTLPLIAIAPLVILWFGFGLAPKILLVAFVTFFPMLVAWLKGYEATEPDLEWLLGTMGAGRAAIFRQARLPSALPYFFAGLRISTTYAVVAAIFAEYAGAARGLGIYILSAKNNFRPDLVLAAVGVSAVLTLCLFGLAILAERIAMPWARFREPRR